MAFAFKNAFCKNKFHLLAKTPRSQRQQVDLQLHERFQVHQAFHQLFIVQIARLNVKVFRCSRLQKRRPFAILRFVSVVACSVAFVQVISSLPDLAEMLDLGKTLQLHKLAWVRVLIARSFQLFFVNRHQLNQVVRWSICLVYLIAASAPAQATLIVFRRIVWQGEISILVSVVAHVLISHIVTTLCYS